MQVDTGRKHDLLQDIQRRECLASLIFSVPVGVQSEHFREFFGAIEARRCPGCAEPATERRHQDVYTGNRDHWHLIILVDEAP